MINISKINDVALQNFLSAEINFELTNHCNIACIYCDNKTLKNKGNMTINDFNIITDKLFDNKLSQKKAIFCGYGESFLNNSLYEMVDKICDMGVELRIQSNGKWELNENRINTLFKINRISVTIDAVTNDVYRLSRPNTDVHKIFDNLKKIISLKDQFIQHKPYITAKMNVFNFNKHQTHEFIHKCKESKFDQICLTKGNGPPEVRTTINKLEFDKYDSMVSIDNSLFETSDSEGNSYQPNQCKSEKLYNTSSQLSIIFNQLGCFDTATIKWDGTLNPCCWDIYSQLSLGNVVTDSLEELFSTVNLNRIDKMIRKHKNNPFSRIPCLSCPRFISNFKLGYLVKTKHSVLRNSFVVYEWLRRLFNDVIFFR